MREYGGEINLIKRMSWSSNFG